MVRLIATLTLALGVAVSGASSFRLFGPGPHWIDGERGGLVRFGASATVSLDLDFDGVADMLIALGGTTTVFRSDAIVGDPVGDPGHRNHLDLEIVSMTLAAADSP